MILLFLLMVVPLSHWPMDDTHVNDVPCAQREEMQLLDFWIGEWDVFVGTQKIGENKIEWILDSCAIVENWLDATGREGKSLFYFYAPEHRWKQIWVTTNPFIPGGVKEKAHVETLTDGCVVFQGQLTDASGSPYLDRTTLQPLQDGSVLQRIELSDDNGVSWTIRFEVVYKPSP